jgi:hydroxymethylbilane synthase
MLIRIATRSSALARWQADHVATLLRDAHPDCTVEVLGVSTEGDRRTDVPLSQIGGKGVFATEVQAAVLDGRADVAVHSAKDLPAVTPDGLVIAAVPERGDPRDALVGSRLVDLPTDATVATGSARRRVQLARLRPDLRFAELRGNMATRLDKAAGFDAVVVAAVALERLGLADRLTEVLSPRLMVPQVAQGALAVECRADDATLRRLLAGVEHGPSRTAVDAERAFLAELGGDCTLPAGAHATLHDGGRISVRGILGGAADADGRVRVHELAEEGTDPDAVGRAVASSLRNAVDRS